MEIFFGFFNSEFINDNTFSLKDKKKKLYRDFNLKILKKRKVATFSLIINWYMVLMCYIYVTPLLFQFSLVVDVSFVRWFANNGYKCVIVKRCKNKGGERCKDLS